MKEITCLSFQLVNPDPVVWDTDPAACPCEPAACRENSVHLQTANEWHTQDWGTTVRAAGRPAAGPSHTTRTTRPTEPAEGQPASPPVFLRGFQRGSGLASDTASEPWPGAFADAPGTEASGAAPTSGRAPLAASRALRQAVPLA